MEFTLIERVEIVMKIGNIECDDNEKIVYTIADNYCTYIENVYKSEGRDFNREHYIVYFTYFVFITRAAIGGLTKKILDTMGNLVGQKVGNGDYLDTFIGKRAYVDYMRKYSDMTGEMLNADKIGEIIMSIEEEFGGTTENKTSTATLQFTIEIFNNIQNYFK